MSPLLDSSSYAVSAMSLPFLFAAIAVGVVFAYAAFMRGATHLRVPMLVFSGGLIPYTAGVGLAIAAPDQAAAEAFFRAAVATVPLAAAGAMTFDLALARRLVARRAWVIAAFSVGTGFMVIGWATPWAVDGIRTTPSGVRFFEAGWLVLPATLVIGVLGVGGFVEALRAYRQETGDQRRRQLRGGIVAITIAFFGLTDAFLAYGIGWTPVSWLFVSVGALLALRSILSDDLLRARAIDSRAPIAFASLVLVAGGGWVMVNHVLPGMPYWLAPLPLVGLILGARMAVALAARVSAHRFLGEGPLDRLANQFASRVYQASTTAGLSSLTAEVLDLGLGAPSEVLIPSADDWSWRRADGRDLDDDQVPDPLLVPWLASHGRPIYRDELEVLGLADLRPSFERMADANRAHAIVPLVSRDDLVGLLILRERASGRTLRRAEAALVDSVAERMASALAYVRVAGEAEVRAGIAREVELAAAVQTAFVPPAEPIELPSMTVLGTWEPASRCGGDWWGCYPLPRGQVLIAIGDVTGSGVAAAMVTAAAKGACDVAVKVMADAFDLVGFLTELDGAVRRVGAGRFHLTCFAAVVDPAAGQVRFANAGHVVPYLCRPRAVAGSSGDGHGPAIELQALVARGNPLGAGTAPVTRTATRPVEAGDVLVFYTDGLVECRSADGRQFGDRRLQRALRRLEHDQLDPGSVHEFLAAELAAHLGGLPAGDDMTLVVARVDGGAAS